MDNYPISANSLEKYFQINGSYFGKQYKNKLSGFNEWEQKSHAQDWILFPQNIGYRLCIDEVALSDGELYTILTNYGSKTQKGSLIAMVKGVASKDVCAVINKIPLKTRQTVIEVNLDMANNMEKIVRDSFPNAYCVTDRFHVAKLVCDAVQHVRIKHRWEAIEKENKEIKKAKQKGKKYVVKVFENGDTRKQLLARSRYLLFKSNSKYTEKQKQRADILFKQYPDIKKAYELQMKFRSIYEHAKTIQQAKELYLKWKKVLVKSDLDAFNTASQSIESHKETILNYFINKSSNALAECFNSKIKAFRATFRGVKDIKFFLYRISLIFA